MALGRDAHGTGTVVRLKIGLQVGAMILVAAGCAYLATWLAGRPGLVVRVDCTRGRSNTLPAELETIVAALPEPVKIETFLRPLDPPFTELSQETIGKFKDFLFVLGKGHEDQLSLVHWDLDDVTTAKARLGELDLREDNVIVVSTARQKTVLRLYRDVAQVEVGSSDPRTYVPPRVASFRPEEALALALKRVTTAAAVRVVFTAGHGERETEAPGEGSFFELARALQRDGFSVERWDPARELELPADGTVLAIADPRQALGSEELDAVRRFLSRGGRVFVVPSTSDSSWAQNAELGRLLSESGIEVANGRVAAPFRDPSGAERVGDARCATLAIAPEGIDPRHPVTESLWRAKRRLALPSCRAFARGRAGPVDATFSELVRAPRNAWIDRAEASGLHAWIPDASAEDFGPAPVSVAVSYAAPGAPAVGDQRPAARIVAFGSADALTDKLFAQNGDFVLNAFNWLAARDWRLSIPPRVDERVRVDVAHTPALAWFNRLALAGLPSVCALFGLVLFLRRRSG
jgi:hypothetical protein